MRRGGPVWLLFSLQIPVRLSVDEGERVPPRAWCPDFYVGVAALGLKDEERVRLALGRTEKAARLPRGHQRRK